MIFGTLQKPQKNNGWSQRIIFYGCARVAETRPTFAHHFLQYMLFSERRRETRKNPGIMGSIRWMPWSFETMISNCCFLVQPWSNCAFGQGTRHPHSSHHKVSILYVPNLSRFGSTIHHLPKIQCMLFLPWYLPTCPPFKGCSNN